MSKCLKISHFDYKYLILPRLFLEKMFIENIRCLQRKLDPVYMAIATSDRRSPCIRSAIAVAIAGSDRHVFRKQKLQLRAIAGSDRQQYVSYSYTLLSIRTYTTSDRCQLSLSATVPKHMAIATSDRWQLSPCIWSAIVVAITGSVRHVYTGSKARQDKTNLFNNSMFFKTVF